MEGFRKVLAFFFIQCFCVRSFHSQHTTVFDGLSTPPSLTQKYFWHPKVPKHGNKSGELETSTVMIKMATPCETPNHDFGYCTEIQKCPILLHQLENGEATDFLRLSRCGPKNEDSKLPRVCCGKLDNFKNLVVENPLPKECGRQNINLRSRIFGGKEATLGEYPWMARLVHKNKYGYRNFGCSAFLIQAKYVMTAAHCVTSDYIKAVGEIFEVQLGEHNTDTDIDCDSNNNNCADKPVRSRVLEVITHHRYNQSTHHNDVALVHMKKSIKFTKYIYPICLPDPDRNIEKPSQYWLSGWGKTESREASPVKMKVSLPPSSWDACVEKYAGINVKIIANQLCAGGVGNRDSCTGDSGGPLMVVEKGNRYVAYGVVSYGIGCGRDGWPGVYTNVSCYTDWVKKKILKGATKVTTKKGITNKSALKN